MGFLNVWCEGNVFRRSLMRCCKGEERKIGGDFVEVGQRLRGVGFGRREQLLELVALGEEEKEVWKKGGKELCHEEDFRVRGCAAVVYVYAWVERRNNGRREVDVVGDADAKVVRGLLTVLMRRIRGLTMEEVMELDVDEVFSEAGLTMAVISSTRIAGLRAVLDLIQRQLTTARENMSMEGTVMAVEGAEQHAGREKTMLGSSPSQGAEVWWSQGQGEDIAVLLSGGVDSSVSMRLLREQGYKVQPFYLKVWLQDELAHLGECPWEEDVAYATAVCNQVGLDLEVVPLQEEYWNRVVQYTVDEARSGRTPNPDIMCNSRVKFGVFYDRFGKDFGKIASGHYAQVSFNETYNSVDLLRSVDDWKDQTYFLSHLRQDQVGKALFPVGSFSKQEVRQLAESYQLPNCLRKDSQGICFLGKLRFDSFLEHHLGLHPGPLVEMETGIQVGLHRGYWFYTLGQRKGLGLSGGPWYVSGKNADLNLVYVTRQERNEQEASMYFEVEAVSWIRGIAPTEPERMQMEVKIRHGPAFCKVANMVDDADRPGVWQITLEGGIHGLAPGQFAAFYCGPVCLGSGVIADRGPASVSSLPNITGMSHKRLQAHYLPT